MMEIVGEEDAAQEDGGSESGVDSQHVGGFFDDAVPPERPLIVGYNQDGWNRKMSGWWLLSRIAKT